MLLLHQNRAIRIINDVPLCNTLGKVPQSNTKVIYCRDPEHEEIQHGGPTNVELF